MVDSIVRLENDTKYLILDETELDDIKYYYGLKLNEDEEPTNNYLFFEEIINDGKTYLNPINDDYLKGILLTSFTINYLNMVYDEVG